MYHALCIAYGETVMTTAGPALLLPRPEVLLAFPDAAFVDLKITSKRRPLRAVAEAYCKVRRDLGAVAQYGLADRVAIDPPRCIVDGQ
jgi:hypothetical protein